MEYFFTDQQKTIKEIARGITEERIKPARAELDEKEEFPWEIVKEIARADLFRVFIPEEYEGLGGGILDLCLAIEEISRGCCGVSISYAAVALGSIPILKFGTEEQKKKYLPQIASGQRLAAFGLTESTAGSDTSAMKTLAAVDGDNYVLNGTKQFISNGGEAEIYTIIAMTNPAKGSRGASALIVEKDTPGFTFGKKEKKMGIRASSTRELIFHNCRVPKANLLGKEGTGFIVTLKTLDESRPGVAAQGVGIAQGALEEAVAYARQRVQFGQPISSFQAIQHMLADMAIQVEAARCLVYAVARTIDSGSTNFSEASAMAKVFAGDMAMRVTTDAVQVMGGAGYMRDYPAEKMMRDAKIIQIYEGTNQVLRNDIISHVYKRKGKRGMNIVVCIKQVPGTTEVKINKESNTLIREGVKSIINPFDTYAIEEGVRLKERFGGKVTVLTMGPPQAEAALREAIEVGADEGILISDRAFAGSDTLATSYVLSKAISKIGTYDLVIVGKQTMDGDTGQVGPEMAQRLGAPFVAYVSTIEEINDGVMRARRMVDEGHEVVEAPIPCVISVTKEINIPRLPSIRGKMKAKSVKFPIWSAGDLGVEESKVGVTGSPTWVMQIFSPKRECRSEMLEGDAKTKVASLFEKLGMAEII